LDARIIKAKEILDDIGLNGERLEMFFMTGSQGDSFANAAKTMTDRVRELGPNPLRMNNESIANIIDQYPEDEESGFRGRST
jgi:coenzyme F420-reducing hydrogenase delta subunit